MPLHPVVVFPLEIFEHIIDQSDDLDGSLSMLSLSCRAFLPRARRNLFFHIHIGHKEKFESAPTFLRARPWLLLMVRCLTIRDYVRRDPFMLLAIVPAPLIAMFPNLRGLEFATDGRGSRQTPLWSRYVLAYKHPVPSLLHKPCILIRHLELTQLRFRTAIEFVQLLCALPNLKSLVCRGTFCIPFAAAGQSLDRYSNVIKQKALYLTYLVVRQTLVHWCTTY